MLPAHDYMLKCSHTFNVLDTRGAVGVTERAGAVWADARPVAPRRRSLPGAAPAPGIPLAERGRTGRSSSSQRRRLPAQAARPPALLSARPPSCWRSARKNCRPATWTRRWSSCAGAPAGAAWASCAWARRAARAGHAAPPGGARRRTWRPHSPTWSRWSKARRPTAPSTPQGRRPKRREGFARSKGVAAARPAGARDRRRALCRGGGARDGPPGRRGAGRGAAGADRRAALRQVDALEQQQRGLLAPDPLAAGAVRRRRAVPGGAVRVCRAAAGRPDARPALPPARRTRRCAAPAEYFDVLAQARASCSIGAERRERDRAPGAARWRARWAARSRKTPGCWTRSTNLVEAPTALLRLVRSRLPRRCRARC